MEEWTEAAKELDILEDNEAWRRDPHSESYDEELIRARLEMLNAARMDGDVRQMLYLIRTSLSRDLGGMGNVDLYCHSHVGTKYLIESYIDAVVATIRKLVNTEPSALPPGLEPSDLLEQFVASRQAFGRSALLLSGGATLGMYHIGVLKTLFEADLLPRIISGSSAGSIVSSVLCTRTDAEMPKLIADFPYGDLAVFEDGEKPETPLDHVFRLLTQGAWIDVKHLTRVMRDLLGDLTFQESYNRTRRILNICVSPSSIFELPTLLNYITAPNVLIWSAVAASCSIPLVFSTAELMVKNPLTNEIETWHPQGGKQRWIDGSVDNDLPMTRLAEMFNVNHFIVSQVNPHVTPFLSSFSPSLSTPPSLFSLNSALSTSLHLDKVTNFAKSETLHRLRTLSTLNIFPNFCNKFHNMLSQKYSGDITIIPRVEYRDFGGMLKNPSPEFMVRACERGEKATWPLIGRVQVGVRVELELDRAVAELRAGVVFPGVSSPRMIPIGRVGSEKGGMGRGRSSTGAPRQRTLTGGLLPLLPINTDLQSSSLPNPRPVGRLRSAKSYSDRAAMEKDGLTGLGFYLGREETEAWEEIDALNMENMKRVSTNPEGAGEYSYYG